MQKTPTTLVLAKLVLVSFLAFGNGSGARAQTVDAIDGTVTQAADRIGAQIEQLNTQRITALADVLTVTDLDNAKDAYVGKDIRVRGTTVITARISTIRCSNVGPCDRVIGVDLSLAPSGSTTAPNLTPAIPIYQNGKPYPCGHSGDTVFDCGRFKQGEITTIEGTYVKTKISSRGYSSGGSTTDLEWRDFYYLEVKSR